ncbi:MAG: PfkB family carbohydrate kinase [Gammaproteobacteria bacterium]|nr:PfkB family carbohydrate kinase [Gammaproteobacteria bacterium]
MSDDKPVCIFGEVLFDYFPDGNRVLGGAPFNIAWHLQAFGLFPHLVSRVGCDREGEQVRSAMESWGLTTRCLQTDPLHPTGRVAVTFVDGEPAYDIVADCAYDHIEPVTASPCKLLYHGTLAARAATSADTLRRLRAGSPQAVFVDVNLRPPWWQLGAVRELLHGAHWVKLNSDELSLLGGASTSANAGSDFLQRYQLRGLLVTHGSKGAELLLAGGECLRAAPIGNIEVVDTVGAGDAFAAIMLLGILNDWPMTVTLQRAQQFATAAVGERGATIPRRQFYRHFIQQWQLAA